MSNLSTASSPQPAAKPQTSNIQSSTVDGQRSTAGGAASAHPDHLYLVVVGHVDHGKSTLIGRLLFDTNSVPEGKAERIQAACKAEGMEFEYAFLMDALLEEQAQNITMDTTRVPFRTERRAFTIIDAPGHKEFLKNMITGAASADAAILIVDAHEGLREQTRRHGYLLSLLGLKQIIVVVNKMDLVNYDQATFDRIRSELGEFLGKLGITPAHFVPISAKQGEGLVHASAKTPWYKGPALLEALEQFRAKPPVEGAPLRLTVQDIYRFDARRIVAGLVETGSVSVGEPIEFYPGGKRSIVKSIETWPVSANTSAPTGPILAGRSVAITLADELFVERGQIGASPTDVPVEARVFTARLFWLHAEPLRIGDTVPLRLGTQQAEARLIGINRTLDAVSLESSTGPSSEVKRHEVAEIRLRVRRPLAFDAGGRIPQLGRFVLIRGRRIAGGGVIDAVLQDETVPAESRPGAPISRAALLGHRGAIVWFTGLSGSGKSTLAAALEKRLLAAGVLAAVLDGDALRTGLSRNLGFTPEDRRENLRRATELALHLADAGVVVIAALISPFRADRAAVAERAREKGVPFAEVFINAPLAECERRDPKSLYKKARAGEITSFTGIDSPYEPPLSPNLEVRTDRESVDASLEKVTSLALGLARPPDVAGSQGANI
jgi:bifunctional enzyme CysN/CysC